MNNLYIVFQDRAAGQMWTERVDTDTDWNYQEVGGCHANNVFESNSLEECEKYIESEIKASTQYAVFQKRDMNGYPYYFYEEIDCTSGTYQEIGGSYSSHICNFDKEDEAKEYIKKFKK